MRSNQTEGMINIVLTGGFSYPYGMAATRRIQIIIDYLERVSIAPKVIILQRKVNGKGRFNLTEYRHINFFRFFAIFLQLSRWKNRKTKNILYVYDGINIQNIGIVILSRMLGYKIVTDIVEEYSSHQEKVSFFMKIKILSNTFFETKLNKITDGIVVISKYLLNKFSSGNYPVTILIPISTHLQDVSIKIKPKNNQVVFAYAGSFGKRDGIPILLKAFNDISQKYENVFLKLAGSGNNIQNLLTSVHNKRIEYVGYLSNEAYLNFIQEADILLMTRINSIYSNAGFPFKLGEYLSTGNAVIASDVSGIKEYAESYKDLILINLDNYNEFIQAMEFLVQNPEKRIEIGANGVNICTAYFNYLTNGLQLLNFLENL
jgi:glycosyltransferase involved in cell wall biosynthesis